MNVTWWAPPGGMIAHIRVTAEDATYVCGMNVPRTARQVAARPHQRCRSCSANVAKPSTP